MTAPCDCGCCAGVTATTPVPIVNRPGLPTLAYRVGTHATFLESMLAALTSSAVPPSDGTAIRPLQDLTTRERHDPSIAFLDAWATIADVLTFYQERLANEGYLRTATTRRSVLELARLVGYRPRPGVAASVYLAFTVDDGFAGILPAGTRAQSVPGAGEQPQFFETLHPLAARDEWNAIAPRRGRPQAIGEWNAEWIDTIYFAGTATKLKPQDPILIVWGDAPQQQQLRRVKRVDVEAEHERTRVTLQVDTSAFGNALRYLRDLFLELQRTLRGVGSTAVSALFTGPTALAPSSATTAPSVAAPDLADHVALMRSHAVALAGTHPAWGVALADLAARHERLGIAYFAEWPVSASTSQDPLPAFEQLLTALARPPAVPPASPEDLATSPTTAFDPESDALPQLVAGPEWRDAYEAWSESTIAPAASVSVHALRGRAPLYGHNAQGNAVETIVIELVPQAGQLELAALAIGTATYAPPPALPRVLNANDVLTLSDGRTIRVTSVSPWRFELDQPAVAILLTPTTAQTWVVQVTGAVLNPTSFSVVGRRGANPIVIISGALRADDIPVEQPDRLSLDAVYPRVTAPSWIAVEGPNLSPPTAFLVENVAEETRAEYGLAVRGTTLTLPATRAGDWFQSTDRFGVVRKTTVYLESELLPLADEPYREDVAGDAITLDGLHAKLDPGRWLIVTGERSDVATSAAVRAGELVMLARVTHAVEQTFDNTQPAGASMVDLPGDTLHSTFRLATPLAYRYTRATVTICANVAKATHGQTVTEVLGHGDAARPLQTFPLRQRPLTYVAAATPSGVASTLVARVDDIEWHETDSLVTLGPADHGFVTEADDDETTTVVFGTGVQGARLPTGVGNVSAQYRYGIGRAGNVAAERISQLASRPPGAKAVINPLRASGGADRDDHDRIRDNAPLVVTALDRLVSEHDYADFALTFAGIGKAAARRISDGRRRVVHVTIAGMDDGPIDVTSDLYRALVLAFREHGDPHQPVEVAARTRKLLVVRADVRIHPDHRWPTVSRAVRAALLDAFGFTRRALAQSAFASEATSVIQGVTGVDFVDLDVFDALPVASPVDVQSLVAAAGGLQRRTHVAARHAHLGPNGIEPAELVVLTPELHDAIMLRKIP